MGGSSGTTYYFTFSIWDNPTVGDGNMLWPSATSSLAVTVREGVFDVNIGDTANGYPHKLDYNFKTNADVYLQVEVSSNNSSFQALSPRQRISSSAFARVADSVSGSSTPSSFGTTTPIGSTVVTIEATSTTAQLLALRAASSQTADLFRVENSSASRLFSINAGGKVFASSTLQASGIITGFSTLDIQGSGTSTFTGGIYANALRMNLPSCGGGSVLETDSDGSIICRTDDGGSVSSGTNITVSSGFINLDSTLYSLGDIFAMGETASHPSIG
ncbi:MAG: hypothetical protein AAB710_00315, partial [Patescibacteria group bacterium]